MVGPNITTFRDITGLVVIVDKTWDFTIRHYNNGLSIIETPENKYQVRQQEAKDFENILNLCLEPSVRLDKEDGDE